MFTILTPLALSLSLLLTSSTTVHAFPTFTSTTVFYLTNCLTSDTQNPYSEISIYADVAQSFANQNPDAYSSHPLGAWQNWEGQPALSWPVSGLDAQQPDSFDEFIVSTAADPTIPFFTEVGCATYTQGFSDGGAIATKWNCYKDQPRTLYTTADHECSTVYYCRLAGPEEICPFFPPGVAPSFVAQAPEL